MKSGSFSFDQVYPLGESAKHLMAMRLPRHTALVHLAGITRCVAASCLAQQSAQHRARSAAVSSCDMALARIGLDVIFEMEVIVGRQLEFADQRHQRFVDQAQILKVLARLLLQLAIRGRR